MNYLKNIFLGVFVGGGLFLAAFPVLFMNEKNTVENLAAIAIARDIVVEVKPDKIDPANDGKLIQFSGADQTEEVLADPVFGVARNAVRLTRKVEMFQWVEEEEDGEDDDPPTYTYKQQWREGRVDSSDFHDPGHENPPIPYDDFSVQAEEVKVGAFPLNDELISQIGGMQSSVPPLEAVPAELQAQLAVTSEGFYLPMSARGRTAPTSGGNPPAVSNGGADEDSTATPASDNGDADGAAAPPEEGSGASSTSQENNDAPSDGGAAPEQATPSVESTPTSAEPSGVEVPASPHIGDLKITFEVSPPAQAVSVISGQKDGRLAAYEVMKGYSQNELRMGTLTAAEQLQKQEDESNFMTWVWRVVGCFMMFIGLLLITRPITALANFVPFLGGIVGFAAFLVAGLLAVGLSLITIAISWVAVRPLIGIPLVLVSVALLGAAIFFLAKSRKSSEESAKPADVV